MVAATEGCSDDDRTRKWSALDDSRREREMRLGRRLVVVLAFALLGFGIAVPPAAADTTALRVEVPGAPKRVHGSDGRQPIEYDLW